MGQFTVPETRKARVDRDEHRSRGPGIFGGYSCPKNPDPPSPRGLSSPCVNETAPRDPAPSCTWAPRDRRALRGRPASGKFMCSDVAHGQLCTGSMSAIRPFTPGLSTHRCSADLTGVGSVRRRLVGMGEVSDATVSLCALCSGAVAVSAVSLTAADVRRRSALHCFTRTMPRRTMPHRTMPHRTVPDPIVPPPAVPLPDVPPPEVRHRLRPSPHLP